MIPQTSKWTMNIERTYVILIDQARYVLISRATELHLDLEGPPG